MTTGTVDAVPERDVDPQLVDALRQISDKPVARAEMLPNNELMGSGDDRIGCALPDLIVDQIRSLREAGVRRLVVACPGVFVNARREVLEALNQRPDELQLWDLDRLLEA